MRPPRKPMHQMTVAGLVLLLLLAGCSQQASVPTAALPPGPGPAPQPTALNSPAAPPSPQPIRTQTPTPLPSSTALPTPVVATATPMASATDDAALFLPACGEGATAVSLSDLPAATSQGGWKHYTQSGYGFTVDVPPNWGLAVGPHYLCLAPAAAPNVVLTIGFRGQIESVNIVRSGAAAGDIITRGTVIILSQTVTRNVLIYQGKDKAILYNEAAEIDTPEIALTASLDDRGGGNYDDVALPLSVQATADQIVATLSSGTPLTTWKTYISSVFHVSVQYPSNWLLDTTGQAHYRGQDGFFQITAAASLAPTALIACQLLVDDTQTHNGVEPQFGHQPTLQIVQIDHQPACLILPSNDQQSTYSGTALLMVDYPKSVRPDEILQFWADKNHIRELGARLKFVSTP